MRYNLYTSNKEAANQYLIDNIGEQCADTFGVPRKKVFTTVYVCSWNIDDTDTAMIDIVEKGITDGLYKSVDDFSGFGWVDDGVL